jgi:hypothetical protein
MGFFDSFPAPEPPPPFRRVQPPQWVEPGPNIMPGTLAVDGVLLHTPDVGVQADGFRVYPYGFRFDVTVLIKQNEGDDPIEDPFATHPQFRAHQKTKTDQAEALLVGVEFPNGRGATIHSLHRPGDGSQPPEPPVIGFNGGNGGGGHWENKFWVWNLPEAGDVSIVYSWLARSVPESRLTLDGNALRAAAARSVVLWPEPLEQEPANEQDSDNVAN